MARRYFVCRLPYLISALVTRAFARGGGIAAEAWAEWINTSDLMRGLGDSADWAGELSADISRTDRPAQGVPCYPRSVLFVAYRVEKHPGGE